MHIAEATSDCKISAGKASQCIESLHYNEKFIMMLLSISAYKEQHIKGKGGEEIIYNRQQLHDLTVL